MLDPFDLVPPDITDVADARLRNRWYHDDNDRLRKARELLVKHWDMSETVIPMMWDVGVKTWVEDQRTIGVNPMPKRRTWSPLVEPIKLDDSPEAKSERAKGFRQYIEHQRKNSSITTTKVVETSEKACG